MDAAHAAFLEWRTVPAPVRGQLVRELGELLREHKADLGALVSIEAGKIRSEGLGEVQEMIDICDLAVGLSRQLFGLTIASERPGHRMMEQWHPLGVVGVISAFNFPVAVWSWNAALAFVCGDPVVWKPSEKTMLTALACQALVTEAARRAGAPAAISALVLGDAAVGAALVDDPRVALVSATGSTRMGRLSRHASPRASAGCCSNWAATTLRSSPSPPTSTSPSAGSSSRQPVPPVNAARRCVGSSRTSRSPTTSCSGSRRPTLRCPSARRWPTARSSVR